MRGRFPRTAEPCPLYGIAVGGPARVSILNTNI
jgi:hypothetical protein